MPTPNRTSKPIPRKRACDACHRRKIQCDGEVPLCNWCSHHGLACTFLRPARTKERIGRIQSPKRKLSGSGEDLAYRIERVEELLAQKSQTDARSALLTPETLSPRPASPVESLTPPLPPPPSAHTIRSQPPEAEHGVHGVCFGKLHFAGHHLGEISSYNGIPYFSVEGQAWMRTRTGTDAIFPAFWGDHTPWQRQPGLLMPQGPTSSLTVAGLSLPSRSLVEEYLHFFCTSHFRLIFPMVDSALFRHTIDVAYTYFQDTTPPSVESEAAKACIFAFLSVVSMFKSKGLPVMQSVDGDECAAKAQRLLSHALQEFNMTGLQTVLMLSMHQLFSGQVQSSTMFHSLACRIMFVLGGHTLPDPWSTPESHAPSASDRVVQTKRHLRKLFWLCYTLDKDISLRTGQPPSIDDDHCDLTLPAGYLDVQYLDKALYSDQALLDETAVPILPGDLRLSLIKSKTCKLLYSARALRKSDAELLRDIRELDDELERWRLSVPRKHRPALSICEGTKVEFNSEISDSVRTIVINFEYHYLVASIHRATGRCRAWAKGETGDGEREGVSSSLALSVEASRSTLIYLRSSISELRGEAFCMLMFYPMSAALTLFCSILLVPLNPWAEADLDLLGSAAELIKDIRMPRLSQNETMHLNMVNEFVTELTRLGRCAVTKARHGL
ncbi:hypothetical protein B0H63DRAFT_167718 [Podospora didyma]|uniref:Zn(2)-C6 fungal-type domain-containing protein n=1 Tax=Podospora didyma TaxID=330526 RepID=A0AAE0NV37_9PEZI|nr:hypothetical protein B0H63DRAFT_167718 [Podospora didyma]